MCWQTGSRVAMRAGLLLGVALLVLPTPAVAQLTDLGTITRDEATGLRWLDLTETTDLSYQDIVTGAGGWTAQGWRHATLTEICQLFTSYAIAPASPCGSGSANQPGEGVRSLQALLGITRVLANQEDTFGFVDNGTPGPFVGRALLTYQMAGGFSIAGVEASSVFTLTDATAIYGHFLVRENSPPVADAGPDQSAFVGDLVVLSGSAADPDGDPITTWLWTQEASPPGSFTNISSPFSATSLFEGNPEGDYVLSLVASDGVDWSPPDTVTITYSINQPPTAVALASPTSGTPPLTVQFDGTLSFDPEGSDLIHVWDFGDGGTPAAGPTPSHTYTQIGSFTAVMRVEDDRGQSGWDSIQITVGAAPIPALPRWGLGVLALLLVGAGHRLWGTNLPGFSGDLFN